MASNQPAYAPAPPEHEHDTPGERDGFAPLPEALPPESGEPAGYDAAVRERPKLPRQRNVARGSTVLGIAAMAAVGAGGVAVAASPAPGAAPEAGPASISAPDVAPFAGETPATPWSAEETGTRTDSVSARPLPPAADPGELLRNRILGQVAARREAAAQAEREAAEQAAAREAAARKVREQAAAAKAAAEEKAKADAEAAARAEAERLAQLARSYITPLASCTLTDGFGTADLWANPHPGQDFTAPTGTPVHAIHSGTITSAGWAGAYGYRIVLSLEDGTQLWYCHLSTMVVTAGHVTTGDTIGRVGATGNVLAPHLHLEVRPDGGAPVDPMPWLAAHDVAA